MNNVRRLAACLVALSATPVLAQPAAEEEGPVTHTDQLIVVTPNPPVFITNGVPTGPAGPGSVAPQQPQTTAPQNEAWDNVNHINGQLVKVGEKAEYLVAFKKTNISTNPIGWMFGFYGLSVSHALNNNIAIRGDVNFFSLDNGTTTGYEVGASLPIYFKRVGSGPFIEPGLITRSFTNSYDNSYGDCYDCSSMSSDTMVGPEMLFGWHWSFDSGLNVAAAFGAARNLDNQDEYGDGVEPAGYFRIGYAF